MYIYCISFDHIFAHFINTRFTHTRRIAAKLVCKNNLPKVVLYFIVATRSLLFVCFLNNLCNQN